MNLHVTEFDTALAASFDAPRAKAMLHQEQVDHMLDHSVMLMVLDREGMITRANDRFSHVLGKEEDELVGREWTSVCVPESDRAHARSLYDHCILGGRDPAYFEAPSVSVGGLVRTIAWVIHVETQGRRRNSVMCIGVDVTPGVREREKLLARLSYSAEHDALTGLVNLARFHKEVEVALGDGSGDGVAVLFVTLDRFHSIVDAAGHEQADFVVRDVAGRLSIAARHLIARCGDSDFAVLVRSVSSRSDVVSLASQIVDSVAQSTSGAVVEVHISASVGIAFSPDHGRDALNLVRNAGIAARSAMVQGGNAYLIQDVAEHTRVQEQLIMEHQLHAALDAGEITVAYQPLVDVKTLRIIGAEALARWEPPGRSSVPPTVFIPLAEEIGLIRRLGSHVLNTACSDIVALKADGLGEIRVSVNLSARQINRPDFVAEVEGVLAKYRMPTSMLELEVTESVLMSDMEAAASALRILHQMGVDISLDDFGTGYSCLAYLHYLSVSGIKIDRSFLTESEVIANPIALVRSIVALAKSLGLRVTTEGVETIAQKEMLAQEGVDIYQGYLFSRPVSIDKFRELMAMQIAHDGNAFGELHDAV